MGDEKKPKNLKNEDSQNEEEQNINEDLDDADLDLENEDPDPDDPDNPDDADLDDGEDTESEDAEEDKDSVPLATFLEEKKKRKSLEKKMADLEDAQLEDGIKARKDKIKKEWIEKGVDPEVAASFADEMANVYSQMGSMKKSKKELIIDNTIDELSVESYYSDIKKYNDLIKKKIKSFDKAGESLSVEDAYLLVVGPKTKLKEQTIDQELKESIKKRKQGTSGGHNVQTSQGTSKSKYNLSVGDRKNLKNLQKVQPEAKWTEKKYYDSVLK